MRDKRSQFGEEKKGNEKRFSLHLIFNEMNTLKIRFDVNEVGSYY